MSGIIGAVFLVTLAEGLFAFLGAAAGHYARLLGWQPRKARGVSASQDSSRYWKKVKR